MVGKFFAEILFSLFQMLDGILSFFRILCGIEDFRVNDETTNIMDFFLQSNQIIQIFLIIFVISIFVVFVSVIVSVVRTIIRAGRDNKDNTHSRTLAKGIGSILTTIAMAVVLLTCIAVSNGVLKYVDTSSDLNSDLSLSQQIFELCVRKGYKTDVQADPDQPIYDEEGNVIGYKYIVVVLPTDGTAWQDNHSVYEIDFGLTSVDEVFGVRESNLIGEMAVGNYIKDPMVDMNDFNMLLAYFTVIMLLISIIWSMLGLVKRLYDLVILFLSLPLISATIPIDDGARFKQWRETVVSKVVLAYGAVISINVFMLMLPMILEINISSDGFTSSAFKAFLLVGGALSINGGQLLFARIFGTSAEESRDMANSARALMVGGYYGGRTAAAGLRTAKSGLGTVAKGAIGATNLAGTILGGNAYRRVARTVADKLQAVGNVMRGKLPTKSELDFAKNSSSGKASNIFSGGLIGAGARAVNKGATAMKKMWKKPNEQTKRIQPPILPTGQSQNTQNKFTKGR